MLCPKLITQILLQDWAIFSSDPGNAAANWAQPFLEEGYHAQVHGSFQQAARM